MTVTGSNSMPRKIEHARQGGCFGAEGALDLRQPVHERDLAPPGSSRVASVGSHTRRRLRSSRGETYKDGGKVPWYHGGHSGPGHGTERRRQPAPGRHQVGSPTSGARWIEEVRERVRSLDHREVTARELDRLHSEQFARDESLPLRREELVAGGVDQRRGARPDAAGAGTPTAGAPGRRRCASASAVSRGSRGYMTEIAVSGAQTVRPSAPVGGNGNPARKTSGGSGGVWKAPNRARDKRGGRADASQRRGGLGGCRECRRRRRGRDPFECLERRPGASLVGGMGVCERQIGRDRIVTARPHRPTTGSRRGPSCHLPWMRQNAAKRGLCTSSWVFSA